MLMTLKEYKQGVEYRESMLVESRKRRKASKESLRYFWMTISFCNIIFFYVLSKIAYHF